MSIQPLSKRSIFNRLETSKINGRIKGKNDKTKDKNSVILGKKCKNNLDKNRSSGGTRRESLNVRQKKKEGRKINGIYIAKNNKRKSNDFSSKIHSWKRLVSQNKTKIKRQ